MFSNGPKKNLIEEAFKKINRANFVLPEYKSQADLDIPFPIGEGQTISQPTTVKMMLNWLDPKPGDKVLDVGSGSGWTTALISEMVGPKDRVFAVERIPELKIFGEENCKKSGTKNARFYLTEKMLGLPKEAPFDRILVSAAADSIPQELIDQLKTGGKMVIPVQNSVYEVIKTKAGVEKTEHYGFAFVPLIY